MVLNIIIDLFDKNFFFAKSNLEMIGKDDKISYYILKSKSAFKLSFQTLSKLEEQIILHLLYIAGHSTPGILQKSGVYPVPPGTKQNLKIPFFANISRSTGPIWAIFFLFWRAQWELSNKKKMTQIWSLDHEINVKYLPGIIQFYEIFQEGYYT